MTMEPPLVKGIVRERGDGAVVVRKRLVGDVEAVHAGMKHRYPSTTDQHPQGGTCAAALTNMS